MAKYLVGCDVGSSQSKAVVIDEEGNVLGSKYIGYPTHTNSKGWAEHDPEDYWNTTADCIAASIKAAKIDPKDIAGVALSAHSPAAIMVDEDLNPLNMSHFWMDRRGAKEAEWINEKVGADKVFEVSGNVSDPYYATVKLLWEKNNRPELYNRCVKFLTPTDYPRMKLTGKMLCDYSNASMVGVVFDIVNRKWDYDMIEEIGLDPDKFPELVPCEKVVGEVTKEAAERTGLAPGTPVIAGTADCNAAWVAGGILDDGDMSLVMGSAGVMGVVHTEPKFTRNLITIVHASESEKMYTTVAATCSCGAALQYFKEKYGDLEGIVADELGENKYTYLCNKAATIAPGSDGLITLPYFMGERTPVWDPIARAVVFGMNYSHTKTHLLRSILEGAALAIKNNFELMKDTGIKMNLPLVMGEGGSQSKVWRQIVTDALNVPGIYMANSMGAPVGDAILAGVGSGVFKDCSVVKDWIKLDDPTEPIAKNVDIYNDIYEIYLELYKDVKGLYSKLVPLVKKLDANNE